MNEDRMVDTNITELNSIFHNLKDFLPSSEITDIQIHKIIRDSINASEISKTDVLLLSLAFHQKYMNMLIEDIVNGKVSQSNTNSLKKYRACLPEQYTQSLFYK